MRRAKTMVSNSELEASLLAPCAPVQAASPQADRPASVLAPSASTFTPPIW